MGGNIITKYHLNQKYTTIFNQGTGLFIRKEDDGEDEPFWASDGPELLDVSITSYCERECSFCYRQANRDGHHIAFSDVRSIILQAKEIGVLQIALGGGNPNQHPDFINILRLIRENGIVPSYTTNGEGLSDEILMASRKYCGAVAISVYSPFDENMYLRLVNRVQSYGIKVNLHIILCNDTIGKIMNWLSNPPAFLKKANAVIFLNYKNVIAGDDLSIKDKTVWRKFYYAVEHSNDLSIGFDSCTVPGIVSYMNKVCPSLIEPCEAARFSAFISEDMMMYPCSFLVGTSSGVNLKESTILDIWRNSPSFVSMRHKLINNPCGGCKYEKLCHGGCAYFPINNCNELNK